jgi:hypothetical protein
LTTYHDLFHFESMKFLSETRPFLSIKLLAALAFISEVACAQQLRQSYPLPSPGYDIALAADGTSVVSMIGSDQLWVRNSQGVARTPSLAQGLLKTQLKADGSIAYLLGLDNRNLFVFDLTADSSGLRSFDALPTDFTLSHDEKKVVVGLDNNTVLASDTTYFQDGAPITVTSRPTSIVISPNNTIAYVAVGVSIVKIDLKTDGSIQKIRAKGSVEKLALSPSGKQLYALTSRRISKGRTAKAISVINVDTGKTVTSKTLVISGAQAPVLDLEAGTKSIFVSSSEPVMVGKRTAGVIQLSVRGTTLGAPRVFALAHTAAGPIAYNESSRTLGVIVPSTQSVQFLRTPRA